MPDGGGLLRDALHDDNLGAARCEIVSRYAALQRSRATEVDSLLAPGVPDRRPEIMPERFDEALRHATAYVDSQRNAGQRATLERVAAIRPRYVQRCVQMAASWMSPSLDHSDLHAGDIFLPDASRTKSATIYDWGQRCRAPVREHAGAAAVTAGRVVRAEARRAARSGAGRLPGSFRDIASRTDVVALQEVACRIGKVTRARALAFAPNLEPPYAAAPFQWVASLVEESSLG